ncbi:hypothetical protein HELRODRAFT_184809 [Helobdella robusta]|uniref:RING-type E3 ubiquitin transferase n=1 Tax=Helobdella robusta TaxID=6412 RepID=T1FM14_HELRO|nr:hypothetical protein HELRODRAFT_184809 [Helobdella robusta]ESO11968.1 hypothetical protein HELRODRAFT_184809 [Helobdella robusta]
MEQPPTPSKTWGLTPYELHRTPQEAVTDNTEIAVSPRSLHNELMCPICLDMLKNTMTTKECLHRFCQECIITALRSGNKECPTCRKKLISKRSLRPDPNFDALISKIYPCRDEYDAHQERVLAKLKQTMNPAALTQNIEEGLRQQALSRNQRKKVTDSESNDTPRKHHGNSDESAGENSMCGDVSSEGPSTGRPTNKSPPEIELVFKPHPSHSDSNSTQVRYIKTTSNASIEHLSKYLAMRIALEKQQINPGARILSNPPSDKYNIFISTSLAEGLLLLPGNLSLAQTSEKYWHSTKPMVLYYALDLQAC